MLRNGNKSRLITDISESEISNFGNSAQRIQDNSEIYELLGFNTSINKAAIEFIIAQNNNKPFQDFTKQLSEKFGNKVFSWDKLSTGYSIQDFSELEFMFKNYQECENYLEYFQSLWKTLESTLQKVPEQEIRILEYIYSLFKFGKVSEKNALHSEKFFIFLITLLERYEISTPQYILVENIISVQLLQINTRQAVSLKNILEQKKRLAGDLGQLLLWQFTDIRPPHTPPQVYLMAIGTEGVIRRAEEISDIAMNEVSIFQEQEGNIGIEIELLLPGKTQRRNEDDRITQVCDASLGGEIELGVDIMEDVAEFRSGNGGVDMTEFNMYSLLNLGRSLNSHPDMIGYYSHHIHVDQTPGMKTYSGVVPFCGNKQGGSSFETKHLPVAIPRYSRISTDNESGDTTILNHGDARYHSFIEMGRHYDQMLLVNGLKNCPWEEIISQWEEEGLPKSLREIEDMSILFESWRQEKQQDLLMKIFVHVSEMHCKIELHYPILRLWKTKLLPNLEFWFKKAIWDLSTDENLTGKHIGTPEQHHLGDTRFIGMSIEDGNALREYITSPIQEELPDKGGVLEGIRNKSYLRYTAISYLSHMKHLKYDFSFDEIKDIIFDPDIYLGIKNALISYIPNKSIPLKEVENYFMNPYTSAHNYSLVHSLFSKVQYDIFDLLPLLQKTYKYKIGDDLFNVVASVGDFYKFSDIESMVTDPEIYPMLLAPLLSQSDVTISEIFEIILSDTSPDVVRANFLGYLEILEFSNIEDFKEIHDLFIDTNEERNIWSLVGNPKLQKQVTPLFTHFMNDLTDHFKKNPEIYGKNTHLFLALNKLFSGKPISDLTSMGISFVKIHELLQKRDIFVIKMIHNGFFDQEQEKHLLGNIKPSLEFASIRDILEDEKESFEYKYSLIQKLSGVTPEEFFSYYKESTGGMEVLWHLALEVISTPFSEATNWILDVNIDPGIRGQLTRTSIERNISYKDMEYILLDPSVEFEIKSALFNIVDEHTRFEEIVPFIEFVEQETQGLDYDEIDEIADVFNAFHHNSTAHLPLSTTAKYMLDDFHDKVPFIGYFAISSTNIDLDSSDFSDLLQEDIPVFYLEKLCENITSNNNYTLHKLKDFFEHLTRYEKRNKGMIEEIDACEEFSKMIRNCKLRNIDELGNILSNPNIHEDIKRTIMIEGVAKIGTYEEIHSLCQNEEFTKFADNDIDFWFKLSFSSNFSHQDIKKIFEDLSISKWYKIFLIERKYQHRFAGKAYGNLQDDYSGEGFEEIPWEVASKVFQQGNEPLSSISLEGEDMDKWWHKFFKKINFFGAHLDDLSCILLDPVFPENAKRYIWKEVSERAGVKCHSQEEKNRKLLEWLQLANEMSIVNCIFDLLDLQNINWIIAEEILSDTSINEHKKKSFISLLTEKESYKILSMIEQDERFVHMIQEK